MREEARVGARVTDIGKALKTAGFDVQAMLSDPTKIEEYSRVVLGFVLAYIAWERANDIKGMIYRIRKFGPFNIGATVDDYAHDLWDVLTGHWEERHSIDNASRYTGEVSWDLQLYALRRKQWRDGYAGAQASLEQSNRLFAASMAEFERAIQAGETTTEQAAPYIEEAKRQHEANVKQLTSDLQEPPPPPWMTASFEEKALYASLGFMLGMHPEMLAELVKGIGFCVQGLGEIIPL